MVGTARRAPLPTLRFDHSNRAFKPAKARRAGEGLEFRMPLFLREGEAGLGVASLGRVIADVEYDAGAPVAGSLSGRQRVVEQGLHQTLPAVRRLGGDMLDQPVVVIAGRPACSGIGAPPP